jgi:NADH-quinone oxidoreductase subunit N
MEQPDLSNNISVYLAAHGHELPVFFYAGVLMMMVGLAFKISAVPFHFWAPDVYEGSPTVITAFMSTVVKIGAIAAFYRIFALCFSVVEPAWVLPLQVIAVLTLVIANITAVSQSNTKRMLAYSSIGHVGYILLAFVANSTASSETIFYYLATYAASSIAAFTVLFILENNNQDLSITSFNGLYKKNPLLAVSMTLALLSLAGIPPLPGFFAKYMVFALAIESGNTPFVIVAIVTSLIGVYYYFRILIAMYFKEPQGDDQLKITTSHRILIYVLIAISVGLGIFPEAVLEVIR